VGYPRVTHPSATIQHLTPSIPEAVLTLIECVERSFFALSLSSTYLLLKHSVLDTGPFDLHVLGTPPAFVLSQDQTLHKIYEEHLIAQISYSHLTSHWLFLVV
ncbi:hypothetical protein, partial [Desulfitobacterium hafniense]|uniref:hypothetical protein n=1 Tax=Desulfitobacterium hafniense TaxID=49338 RepID=UPI001A9A3D3E